MLRANHKTITDLYFRSWLNAKLKCNNLKEWLIENIMRTISIFIFLLLFSQFIVAQTEEKTDSSKQNLHFQNGIVPSPILSNSLLQPFDFPFEKNITMFSKTPSFQFQQNNGELFKHLFFEQNKIQNEFPMLGNMEHFSNRFIYKPTNKITAEVDVGLVRQNTVLRAFQPNYQFTVGASFEYALNEWLSAYLYGRYLTPSLGLGEKFFDPLLVTNPLFVQPEIGSGLRAKHKKIKLDVGMSKIYNTQLNSGNDVGYMKSKLIIGFWKICRIT